MGPVVSGLSVLGFLATASSGSSFLFNAVTKLKAVEPSCEKNLLFAYVKTKSQIRCVVTKQLISAFVFAT